MSQLRWRGVCEGAWGGVPFRARLGVGTERNGDSLGEGEFGLILVGRQDPPFGGAAGEPPLFKGEQGVTEAGVIDP